MTKFSVVPSTGLDGIPVCLVQPGAAQVVLDARELARVGDGQSLIHGRERETGIVDGDLGDLPARVVRLAEGDVAQHGHSGDPTAAKAYHRFLEVMREQVRLNSRNGLSDFEMKPRVAEALAAYRNWSGLNENLGQLVSAAYQEIEAEEF